MIIASCGDSFFYGSDLRDPDQTWPSLIAAGMGTTHQCFAEAGVGNSQILQQIIRAYHKLGDTAVYLINWTWIDRFDYVSTDDESWHTVRPSLDDSRRDGFYYRNFHSELSDKFHNLVYISQAQEILKHCRYIMTYMDDLLLDRRWHVPDYVEFLQDRVAPGLSNFGTQNFLDWSRDQGFPISDRWHPLEEAHAHAAAYWLPKVKLL